MPLLPMFTNDPWYYYHHRPSRLAHQHFGNGLKLEELLAPLTLNSLEQTPSNYFFRQWMTPAAAEDAGSTIHATKDHFDIDLDVKQFAPEEITVTTSGTNCITVEGNHEEKEDDHGFVSRRFVRKYFLPKGHDIEQIVSKLHSDGVLSIRAPRLIKELEDHRPIPIEQSDEPSKVCDRKSS